ncbi:hypothetical protein QYM36_004242 [Artemia franciscana]|nr:hypothetical protein QYM36_004242 [Artemia franciscana]
MVELKNMVSDGNSKLSKSQILKKAIDTIRYLQNVNERLRDENYRLRAASGKSPRIEDLLSSQPRYTSASCGQVTPPHSDISDVPSPFSSGSDVEPVSPTNYKEKKRLKLAEPKKKNGSGVARAMIDRSRITLCMFTLAVLVFNPFGRVFEVMYAEDEMQFNKRSSGRNLRSIDETPSFLETTSGLSLLLTSVINIMLLTLVFLRLFVYGEPIPDQKSEAVTSYWRHRKQADSDYDSGNYQSSAKQYTLALSTLGRCLPTSRFDAFASVVWQGIRQLLHLCGLGKWLGARAGGLIQPKARRIGCRSILAEIAFCYHRLNQLQLTNHLRLYEESLPDSRFQCLYGLSLCLAALNMAEGAGSALSTEQLAEVYMTTAVRMKLVFNSKRKILSRFWLRKARDVCTKLGSSIPPHLQWLCSPHGHRFFLRYDWCFMKCVSPFFTKSERKGDPLCLLMQMYRQYVLHCAFDAILASNRPSKKNDAAGIVPEGDALTYINLLDGICYAPSASGDDLKGIRIEEYDSVCSWWGSILLAANHWLLGENDKVTLLHPRIEAGPGTSNLLSLQNAMLAAYRSRRLAACKAREEVCYKLIGKASKHLEFLLAVPQSSGDNIVLAALLIAYDWVLEARTLLWEYTYKGQEVPPPTILSRFQDDLAKMRKLAHQLPSGLPKMFPHELTVRAMAGGASAVQERKPLRHRQRHLQGRGYEEESGSSSSDREEIAVLMRENMTSGIVEDQLEKPKETDFLKKKNDDFGVIKNLGTALITLQSAAR